MKSEGVDGGTSFEQLAREMKSEGTGGGTSFEQLASEMKSEGTGGETQPVAGAGGGGSGGAAAKSTAEAPQTHEDRFRKRLMDKDAVNTGTASGDSGATIGSDREQTAAF
eukprot:SAG22_NODE_7671_length_718_cov_1.187399_2_plen_109_part_01